MEHHTHPIDQPNIGVTTPPPYLTGGGKGGGSSFLPPIFNCSNDMALAANVRQYFPPKRIMQMEEDLADLANYWPEGPWGWSLATKQKYKQMGIPADELPSDEHLNLLRQLSSREFACTYIKDMLAELQDSRLLGHQMHFCKQLPQPSSIPPVTPRAIEGERGKGERGAFTLPHREGWDGSPYIFKSPWSSSGRGVFVSDTLDDKTTTRLQGYIKTQGGYAMDKFYSNKVLDFAMEFLVHPQTQEAEFLGYSVFHAAENGAYGYNYVESQEKLKSRIDIDDSLLQTLIQYHKKHLTEHLTHPIIQHNSGITTPPSYLTEGGKGSGSFPLFVGIDMLKCSDGTIHPCIEINLRMNMGILAILLHKQFGDNATVALTPQREHGFQAVIDAGKLMITFRK